MNDIFMTVFITVGVTGGFVYAWEVLLPRLWRMVCRGYAAFENWID